MGFWSPLNGAKSLSLAELASDRVRRPGAEDHARAERLPCCERGQGGGAAKRGATAALRGRTPCRRNRACAGRNPAGPRQSYFLLTGLLLRVLLGTGAGVWAVFAGWRELMINRSQFLAGMIDRSADRGGYVDGMLIGLDALPDEKSASLRQRALPLEASAENALDGAWHKWSSSWGERRLLTGHTGGVTAVAFSPNGARVLTGSFDMTARLWPMFSSAQALVEEVKASAPRCLTPTQREAHNLGTPPPRWC